MSSISKFFSSLSLLLLLNILVKPLWIFAIDRQVQNIVGLDNYGKYFALFNFTIVFNFLLDLGITTYYNQRTASGNTDHEHFSQAASLKLVLGIVYAIIIGLAAWIAGVDNLQWLTLLAIIQFLFSAFLFLRSHITAAQLFTTDAWLSVTDKSIMIICCGVMIYKPDTFGPITITRFMLLQIFSILISIILALIIIVVRARVRTPIKFKVNFSIFKHSWPFGLIVLLMSAINRQDAFLLERLHTNGDHEAGVYASAYRLLDAANMVCYLVAAFLLPYVARNWNKGEVKRVVALSRNLLLVMATGVIAFVLIYAWPLQKLLYHNADPYQVMIIRLCIPALIGYALVQVYGTVLTASGSIKLFLQLSIPFFILNLILNIFLVPQYGAKACCIIAIITQVGYGITIMLIAGQKSNREVTSTMTNFIQT